MKINWLKIVIAVVLIGAAGYWAVTSTQISSYDGSTLAIDLGSGVVTVHNPSDQPVAAQLIGRGTRAFNVASTVEGLSGAAERVGTGRDSTYVFNASLPSGTSTFTIVRGAEIQLVTAGPTDLKTTVEPISNDETRTILIVTGLVILGSLYLLSGAFGHAWIKLLRTGQNAVPEVKPLVPAEGGQGSLATSYGDNRAKTPK